MEAPPNYEAATRTFVDSKHFPKGTDTKYALISLSSTDRICFLRFPEQITTRISQEVLPQLWAKGIQHVTQSDESLEFKLRGNPLWQGSNEEKLAIRKGFLGIFDSLAKEGWSVVPAAGGLGRLGPYATTAYGAYADKDSLIFRYQQPEYLHWVCISFDSNDLIHLVNAPQELADAILVALGEKIERSGKDLLTSLYEIKLKHAPWNYLTHKGGIQGKLLLLDVFQCLEEQGFQLRATVDLDDGVGGSKYRSSGEIWYCCR